MLKSKKRFVLSNETVNGYGFRVLTDGINLDQFKRNPLMLWMHHRATNGDKNQILPLGHWEDLQLSGTTLYGTPVFDDTDSFAMSIYNKTENGTIKMTSAGLLPVEWSEEPKYIIDGQKKPTLIKSILQEVSIVDVGANSDALAQTLYDLQGNKINLFSIGSVPVDKASSSPRNLEAAVSELLSEAYNDNKILISEMPYFKKIALNDFYAVKNFFDGKRKGCALTIALVDSDWDTLYYNDGLGLLKKYEPEIYDKKFFDKFGRYPKNK